VRDDSRGAVVMREPQTVAALLLILGGCGSAEDVSSHPRALVVAQEVGGDLCAHLAACYPDHFAARFDGGVAACVDEVVAGIPADRLDSCDADRVARCRDDVRALACEARPADEHKPSSCEGC
jgi:hypothetical protein